MGKVTNEMLMAFVDGELEPALRERIEVALESDPELRKRATIFAATREPIASVFDPILSHPTSAHAARIRGRSAQAAPAVQAVEDRFARLTGLFHWFSSVFAPPRPLAVAAMLCIAFLAGLSVGWLTEANLAPSGSREAGLIGFRNDGLVAMGGLERVLEGTNSGARVLLDTASGQGTVVKPILTFRDHQKQYCREYEVAFGAAQRFAGLACRNAAGVWNVLVHTPITTPPMTGDRTAVASGGGTEAVDAIVDRIIEGDALGPEREAAVLANGWHNGQ